MKKNSKIKVHMYASGKEIETRNFDKTFTVYEKGGKLGIDWNTEKSPYTCKGEKFCPLETFATYTGVYGVIFENVETGEKFTFSNIKNGLEKIA